MSSDGERVLCQVMEKVLLRTCACRKAEECGLVLSCDDQPAHLCVCVCVCVCV